jgi:hypothetical protein
MRPIPVEIFFPALALLLFPAGGFYVDFVVGFFNGTWSFLYLSFFRAGRVAGLHLVPVSKVRKDAIVHGTLDVRRAQSVAPRAPSGAPDVGLRATATAAARSDGPPQAKGVRGIHAGKMERP